jgi:hypothetical protein
MSLSEWGSFFLSTMAYLLSDERVDQVIVGTEHDVCAFHNLTSHVVWTALKQYFRIS